VPPTDDESITNIFSQGPLLEEYSVNLLSAAPAEDGLLAASIAKALAILGNQFFQPTQYFLGVHAQPSRNPKTPQRSP